MTFITFLIALFFGSLAYVLAGVYLPQIKKVNINRRIKRIQSVPSQPLPLDSVAVLVEWMGRDKSKDLAPPRFETKELPQNEVGLAMDVREWIVYTKNKNAIDADFEIVEN
jgi:hypothetical protein